MNNSAMTCEARSNVAFAEVTAVVRRRDGSIEHHVLERRESAEHRAERELLGLELPAPTFSAPPPKQSAFARLLKWVGIGALLVAAHYAPEYGPAIAATVITNGGQAIVTNLVSGIGGTVPGFVAWGTGAGTAAVADTTLFTESTEEARTNGTKSRVTTTVTNDTFQVVGTITVVTSGKTITNVGLFDASTSGNLYFKSDFTGLALSIGDSITFTLKVKYS